MGIFSFLFRNARRALRVFALACGAAAGLYALAVLVLGFWTTGGEEAGRGTVPLAVCGGGAHTDFGLPARHAFADGAEQDWTRLFPPPSASAGRPDLALFIGWGEKEFFLHTPTWADLRPLTALRALAGGSSALRVIYGARAMMRDPECRALSLTEEQYRNLVRYVEAELVRDKGGGPIFLPGSPHGGRVAFYAGSSRFSGLVTCNTWILNGLKAAGQRTAVWTPLEYFVLRHLPEPAAGR